MADIFQGEVLPDVKTTTATETTAPQYFTDYLSGLAGAAGTALAKPENELVAGMQPLQTAGYAAIPAAATAYQPGLTAAGQTASSAAGVDQADIEKFMNPYTASVVNEMGRLSQQNVQRNLLPTMKAGFVGSGGLGSQRYATALGQGLADTQSNLTGQQYGALSSGYKSAVDQAIQNAQAENMAAKTQADIAGQEQSLGLTGAGAMTKAGAEQQAYEQAQIDAPLKQATNASALLRGYQVPTSVTEKFTGPKAGSYALSPLQQITGLGSLIGSGLGSTTTKDAAGNIITKDNWLSNLWNQTPSWDTIKGYFSTSDAGGDVNNSAGNDVGDSSGGDGTTVT